MIDETAIKTRYGAVAPLLDERARRLMAGSEALALGRGGVAAVARATGLARSTVRRGVADVRARERVARGRVRRAGAGRPPIENRDPTLRADLEALIEPTAGATRRPRCAGRRRASAGWRRSCAAGATR